MARLRRFILAVYCTYLAFGVALMFGLAVVLRSTLATPPVTFRAGLEVAVGGALVGIGVRAWRRRRGAAEAVRSSPRSGLTLGVLATVADLPTAGPLLAATALLAAANATAPVRALDLVLYDLVYVSPLLAMALVGGRASGTADSAHRQHWSSVALAALCICVGTIIGSEGVSALA